MNEPCVYDGDRLLASAARFLIDGQEEDAANVLLSCSLDVWESGETWYQGDERLCAVHVEHTGPRMAYDILNNRDHPITKAVLRALEAVLPTHTYIKHFAVAAELMSLDPRWREELLEIARGKGVHNQAIEAKAPRIWNNLRFRSESEVRVARALDQANVMFLPNCRARIGLQGNRQNREADFLVCHNGKLGILEVDVEPFHPPSRTAEDHERDRLFKLHGILVVEHFDAGECFENPAGVVARFLNILKKA
jgi:very-short-patch-repair endonuclease